MNRAPTGGRRVTANAPEDGSPLVLNLSKYERAVHSKR